MSPQGKAARYASVLVLICAAAALGVSLVYSITRERIELRKAQEVEAGRAAVFGVPGVAFRSLSETEGVCPVYGESQELTGYEQRAKAGDSAVSDQDEVLAAYDGDKLIGYLAMGAGQGYKSRLQVLVGASASEDGGWVIYGVFLLDASCQETPGLGTRIKEKPSSGTVWGNLFGGKSAKADGGDEMPRFWSQFKGKTYEQLVVTKAAETGKIQAISGATISSRGMTAAVRNGLWKIEKACAALKNHQEE